MPIYEYSCSACDHRLEALQKPSEDPLVYCPECGEPGLRKLVSAAAFRLKGTGWYETDFKHDSKKKKQDKEAKTEAATDTKTNTDKSDTGADSKSSSVTDSSDTKSSDTKDKASTAD